MPRTPRVEFENACYHVMARDTRREPILIDLGDRDWFEVTLEEEASRCGWAVWRETIVPQKRIAKALDLKSAANASQQIRRFAREPE